jgi:hypothetical protein
MWVGFRENSTADRRLFRRVLVWRAGNGVGERGSGAGKMGGFGVRRGGGRKGLFWMVRSCARARSRWVARAARTSESWWRGGGGGALSWRVTTLAIGGKKRARLQVQACCNNFLILLNAGAAESAEKNRGKIAKMRKGENTKRKRNNTGGSYRGNTEGRKRGGNA